MIFTAESITVGGKWRSWPTPFSFTERNWTKDNGNSTQRKKPCSFNTPNIPVGAALKSVSERTGKGQFRTEALAVSLTGGCCALRTRTYGIRKISVSVSSVLKTVSGKKKTCFLPEGGRWRCSTGARQTPQSTQTDTAEPPRQTLQSHLNSAWKHTNLPVYCKPTTYLVFRNHMC